MVVEGIHILKEDFLVAACKLVEMMEGVDESVEFVGVQQGVCEMV
jgi:hypothetical protein